MESGATKGTVYQIDEVKRGRLLPKALVIGLVAGLISSAFRVALNSVELHRIAWVSQLPPWEGLGATLLIGAIGGGVAVALVRRYSPESAGSGIPHMKSVVLGEAAMRWERVLPVKFVGGLVGIGSGLAMGREGPTIQIGGATGLLFADLFRVKRDSREALALISAGAAAGLAAAFNAPLAGVMFVLEELHGSFTPVIFVASFLASVAADVVCRVLTGDTPIFTLKGMSVPALNVLPVALVVGLFAGFGGVLFNLCLLKSLDLFDRLRRWPPFSVGALAGVVVGIAAWVYPGVGGSGSPLAERALAGEFRIRWVLVLILARFVLTMVSYGCGAPGGIFAPLLVIGALGGLAVGGVAHVLTPDWAPHAEIFVVLGMGALLTSIVRAPLTGIVLMIELTGKYDFMLPLLVSCFGAYWIADAFKSPPIYEALRDRAAHQS